jgi:hypothetical protein
VATAKGKIINPFSINANVIEEIEAPINLRIVPTIGYQASSLTSFIEAPNRWLLPTDLSNAEQIYILSEPSTYGLPVFKNNLTEQLVCIYLDGNESEEGFEPEILDSTKIQYIDEGKYFPLFGGRNESFNTGWEPVSNQELYSHIERSDFDAFDLPIMTPRSVRKIPKSGETLCGPVEYTGYSYDRLNYNWLFGDKAGITFNNIMSGSTPVSLSGSVISNEGCSSISNEEGKLLFYTNGETVYTSGGTVMTNGSGLNSSGTSTQSSIIIPRPDSNKYYIFTTDFEGSTNGLQYSIVNMDLSGGDGMVEAKNVTLLGTPTCEKVTACNHSNGTDYWVITHTSGDSTFHSYKIDGSGITSSVSTSIGTVNTTTRGYMKTSPDCNKLVSLLYDQSVVDIFDFDSTGGTLSNHISLTGFSFDIGPYGLEFSSDSTKIYVSEGAGEKVYQFDLSYTSSTEMIDNVIEVGYVDKASLGALQMGPDEKIYLADLNKDYLHVIHWPNGLGVLCNFQEQYFSLSGFSGTTSKWGLPNVITSKALSCDRYVYVTPQERANFDFDFVVNDVNNVITPKMMSYTGEIYKYDQETEEFTDASIYTFNVEHESLSGDPTNTIRIPVDSFGSQDGEYLVKSYWQYNVNTLISKQLQRRRNTYDTYKRGNEYLLYNEDTDWYFVNVFEALQPLFTNTEVIDANALNTLVVESQLTESGKTEYFIDTLSEPIVAYIIMVQYFIIK